METGVENAYSCVVLGGARSMEERRRNLQAFKDGDVRFLICTDVAARGIDIQGLPFVINMTLPDQSEDYIHRVGRVGRADHMGLAISIVSGERRDRGSLPAVVSSGCRACYRNLPWHDVAALVRSGGSCGALQCAPCRGCSGGGEGVVLHQEGLQAVVRPEARGREDARAGRAHDMVQ